MPHEICNWTFTSIHQGVALKTVYNRVAEQKSLRTPGTEACHCHIPVSHVCSTERKLTITNCPSGDYTNFHLSAKVFQCFTHTVLVRDMLRLAINKSFHIGWLQNFGICKTGICTTIQINYEKICWYTPSLTSSIVRLSSGGSRTRVLGRSKTVLIYLIFVRFHRKEKWWPKIF